MWLKLLAPAVVIGLAACGGEQANESGAAPSPSTNSSSSVAHTDSQLTQYLSDATICGVLSTDKIKSEFGVTAAIETRPSSYGNRFTCSYSWDRPDAEEREKKMIGSIMAAAQGGAKLSMREKTPSGEIAITLGTSTRKAAHFVPRKLTDEQLQAQIDAAQKATDEKLTNEQKAAAGDMAKSFTEKLLKKNNQNEEIKGVGDAAFWSKMGFGSLNVHFQGVEIYIAPMIADTEEEDVENAKRVFSMLNN